MTHSPWKFEYKKTLPGWEGSTVTLETVQTYLRSFTNQHFPLGAKYDYDQKLAKETYYNNAGNCCSDQRHKRCDTFLRTCLRKSLLVVVSG